MIAFRKLLLALVVVLVFAGTIPATISAQPQNETDVAIGFFEQTGTGLLGDIVKSSLYHDIVITYPQTVYFNNNASYLDASFNGHEYRIEIYSTLDGHETLEYQLTYTADEVIFFEKRITVPVTIHDSDPNPTDFQVGLKYVLFEHINGDHWNRINGYDDAFRATVIRI